MTTQRTLGAITFGTVRVSIAFVAPPDNVTVQYRCECGWASSRWCLYDRDGDPNADVDREARDQLLEHLVDEHPGAVAYGRCAKCRTVTDYFRAHIPELDADSWLCEDDGPNIPTVIDQAGNDTEEIQWATE